MNAFDLPTDPLFQLERRIAQRADELARLMGVDRGHALEPWRQAEREVWQDIPAALAGSREEKRPTRG